MTAYSVEFCARVSAERTSDESTVPRTPSQNERGGEPGRATGRRARRATSGLCALGFSKPRFCDLNDQNVRDIHGPAHVAHGRLAAPALHPGTSEFLRPGSHL